MSFLEIHLTTKPRVQPKEVQFSFAAKDDWEGKRILPVDHRDHWQSPNISLARPLEIHLVEKLLHRIICRVAIGKVMSKFQLPNSCLYFLGTGVLQSREEYQCSDDHSAGSLPVVAKRLK